MAVDQRHRSPTQRRSRHPMVRGPVEEESIFSSAYPLGAVTRTAVTGNLGRLVAAAAVITLGMCGGACAQTYAGMSGALAGDCRLQGPPLRLNRGPNSTFQPPIVVTGTLAARGPACGAYGTASATDSRVSARAQLAGTAVSAIAIREPTVGSACTRLYGNDFDIISHVFLSPPRRPSPAMWRALRSGHAHRTLIRDCNGM